MASESGRPDPSLSRTLFAEGFRFDFFQAVRLLESIYPEREAVGGQASPQNEVVRFQTHLSLSFPPSAIQQLDPADGDNLPARMTAAFMGLTGPLGVLPRHYTELMLERVRRRDTALRDFFDLFNHRLISLFYRAWEKYRFHVAFERAQRAGNGYDRFSLHLFDFVGMGTGGLRGRLEVGDDALLFYAGLLGQHPHSAGALANVLSDYFAIPVKVEQFVGQWLEITAENRSRLGQANSMLGLNALAGTQIWDQQAKFKLRVGPLSFVQFNRLLSGGDMHRPFIQMARYCAGQEFDFDVQLVLRAPEVPWCRLGHPDARLGFSTWLKTAEFIRDADQVIFSGGLTQLGALPD
jgi:type VI secretion system protein ImpH